MPGETVYDRSSHVPAWPIPDIYTVILSFFYTFLLHNRARHYQL